jgi:hypothetical protein
MKQQCTDSETFGPGAEVHLDSISIKQNTLPGLLAIGAPDAPHCVVITQQSGDPTGF